MAKQRSKKKFPLTKSQARDFRNRWRLVNAREIEELRPQAKEDAANLGPVVLEHEVRVTRRGPGAIRNFAADPGQSQMTLDQQTGGADQQRNRDHRCDAPIAHA